MTLKKFKDNNVKIFLKHKVTEVQGKTLIMEDENENTVKLENVDKIVMATGMKSYRPFETNIPGHFVGDAKLVAKAQEAIHDAYTLALNI
jgi:NADH dehydrogenase FAD-containing subunit